MSRAQISLAATDDTAKAFSSVNGRLDALGAQAAGVVARFAGVAAAIAAVMQAFSMVREVSQSVDALNDLKDATGASIGNLSALEDVAARTGTSFQTVGQALVKFNAALAGAKPGTEAAEVFKRLGLSVAELKTQDPAEAFRQTAVALARFADDGNKARAVQELFGKSLREVAPLLADVAKAGELVATVTDEQAAQAEKFNQQLDALAKNATDVKRALVGDLLPGLNKVLQAFNLLAATKEIGLGTIFAEAAKGNTFSSAADGVAFYSKKLADLQTQFKLVAEGSKGVARRGALIDLAKDIQQAEQLEAYYRKLNKLTAPDLGQTDPTELARRGRGAATPSIGEIGDGKGIKDQASELDKYLQKLREGLLATQDISREEQARIDINRGLLGVLTDAQQQQVVALAGALDSIKAQQASAKAYAALQEEGRRTTEGLRTEQEKLNDSVSRAEVLLAAGVINWQTYGRAVVAGLDAALKKVDELGPAISKALPVINQVSDATRQPSQDLNNALGDSVLAAMEGNAKSIGDIWKNLLKRMAAQAIQAQLAKALFGEGYGTSTGKMGGLIGSIGSLFSGARANGGPVHAGRAYLVGERGPEIMVPKTAGTVLPNGTVPAAQAGVSFTVNVQGDASENTVRLIQGAMANFEARMMSRRGA